MKSFEKRLQKLERITPPRKDVPANLVELYRQLDSNEGRRELDALYNPNRTYINPTDEITK